MFGSVVLEVGLGLAIVYVLLSVFCSALKESIAGYLGMRAATLQEGIRNLLSDGTPQGDDLVKKLYEHPLISGFAKEGKRPSYIPSRTFTLALMDIAASVNVAAGPISIESVRNGVAGLPESVRKALLPLIDDGERDLKRARENIEKWFDDAMDRVSGWYKRRAQLIIIAFAFLLTVLVDADTIHMANVLWRDSSLRGSLASAAVEAATLPTHGAPDSSNPAFKQLQERVESVALPIGWSSPTFGEWYRRASNATPKEILKKVIGLALTTIAVSLGAPFWFDILGKLVNLRATGDPPARRE
jgi:hypothetical protein